MISIDNSANAGGTVPPATIKVWDPFVRIFHWSIVALFAIAFLTGDEIKRVHIWAGYGIAALVALRIVWGFIGPRHARFSSFVKGPREVIDFILQSTRFQAPRSIGHNPAGGIMIVALLAILVGLSVTGHMMTTDAHWGSEAVEGLHEALAFMALGLVGLHVLGVVIASIEHGENLVTAMVTGCKKRPLVPTLDV